MTWDEYNESRIGFTLSEDPRLVLNGQEWTEMNAQLGIDGEDVGTGLGAAAIVVTVVVVAGVVLLFATYESSDCSSPCD